MTRARTLLALLALTSAAHAEPLALVGARVHPVSGPALDAIVIIDGDRIVEVRTGAPPAGARILDATGAVITPGLVETSTSLGLAEISLEASTVDTGPEGEDADPIRAAFLAADGLNPRSTLVPIARAGGVTSVVCAPSGGLVPGRSAWVDLVAEEDVDRALVRSPLALHVDLGDEGIASAGGARSTALGRLREALDDARLYSRGRAAFDRRAFRETELSRLDLEALGDALARRVPVVVRVSSRSDVPRVIELARAYGLRLILEGAEEAWAVAPRIAAARAPVIVQTLQNLPTSFSALGTRFDNAARLFAAGVTVLLSTGVGHGHGVANLRQEAGNAVAHGLPWEAALRAVTLEPARAFGMDRDYGSIAPGRVANLVVWSGDPFELATRVRHVIVRGRDVALRTRQSALLDRYRRLPAR